MSNGFFVSLFEQIYLKEFLSASISRASSRLLSQKSRIQTQDDTPEDTLRSSLSSGFAPSKSSAANSCSLVASCSLLSNPPETSRMLSSRSRFQGLIGLLHKQPGVDVEAESQSLLSRIPGGRLDALEVESRSQCFEQSSSSMLEFEQEKKEKDRRKKRRFSSTEKPVVLLSDLFGVLSSSPQLIPEHSLRTRYRMASLVNPGIKEEL